MTVLVAQILPGGEAELLESPVRQWRPGLRSAGGWWGSQIACCRPRRACGTSRSECRAPLAGVLVGSGLADGLGGDERGARELSRELGALLAAILERRPGA